MTQGEQCDFSTIMEDNLNTYFMKKLITHDLLIDKQWEFYRMNLNYSRLNVSAATADVTVILNYDYRNKGQEVTTSVRNIEYRFKLNNSEGKWKITEIIEDSKEFVNWQTDLQDFNTKWGLSLASKETIDHYFAYRAKEAEEYRTLEEKWTGVPLAAEERTGSSVTPMATFSYDSAKGSRYAQKYAPEGQNSIIRLFYYIPGGDCTNFVSQCVWAAYGGWVEGNDAKSKENIRNCVRMVAGIWQGGGGGTPNWEQVLKFFSYVISSKTYGPKGSKFAESVAKSFPLSSIRVGDVLQVKRGSGGTYGHSVYVSVINGSTPDKIFVCQHSSDIKNRPLENLISGWGGPNTCYIRGAHFYSAQFQK
ncbi:MAG: hypothetical protein STSR0004_00540 [Peptococcaceae bacterium]